MTKIEKIAALIAAATTAATQVERQAALLEASAMKKAAKVSFAKLGISDLEIQNATIAAQTPDAAETTNEKKVSTLRTKALELLEAFEGGYAARIKLLMDTFGISKANANYYVSRVAKGKK